MSDALELKAKMTTVLTDIGITRINLITTIYRITDSIAIIHSTGSDNHDLRSAVQGLEAMERDLLTDTEILTQIERDIDNYRESL